MLIFVYDGAYRFDIVIHFFCSDQNIDVGGFAKTKTIESSFLILGVPMRFIADGIDVPDELLWAQDEGRVVFFCGAGVSRAKAGLHDFIGLTQNVLDQLGALPDDDARRLHEATAEMDIKGLATSDQVFQRLRRSFTDNDIGKVVAQCLKHSDVVDLSAHKTLLKLGKLQTGETRLITTNFDA